MSDEIIDRHSDTKRNRRLNKAVSNLEEIVCHHDPETDVPIKNGVWDCLDRLLAETEIEAAAQVAAAIEKAFLNGPILKNCTSEEPSAALILSEYYFKNGFSRSQAANLTAEYLAALATDTQTDALELVRKEAALKALADMGQEWDADTAAAQVAAAYERAADLCVDQFQAHLDLVITGNPDNARNRDSAANMAEKLSHEIRALATDTQTDALEQVRREAERAGYERMRAKADKLLQSIQRIDDASNHYAMTPTYSEGTLRYAHQSTRNLAREALKEWYEGDPDEQTKAQKLAFRKAVSS